MKKVLLSCMAIAVGAAIAVAQDDPVYPNYLDITLNGEKELSGVTVSQNMRPYEGSENLYISITGECASDALNVAFQIPEGWDYALIGSIMENEDNPFKTKTRSSHWVPASLATAQGYTKGNEFNFPVNGTKIMGTIYLASGDNVWEYPIDIYYDVTRAANASGEWEYPEQLSLTLNGEKELSGVKVKQEIYFLDGYENLSINITGESDANEITIDMTTPAGWDGMLVSATSNLAKKPSKIKVKDESMFWGDIDQALGVTPGNSVTFKVNGNQQSAFAYLTKDGKFYSLPIEIYFKVSKSEGSGDDPVVTDQPKFPETVDYTINGEAELPGVAVNVTSGADGLSMNVDGTSEAEEITLTFAVPEGWDGWLINAPWAAVSEQALLTRGMEEWYGVDFYKGLEYQEGNSVTFLVEEESNFATLLLYKDGKVCPTEFKIAYSVKPATSSDDPTDEPSIPESIGVTTYAEGLTVDQEKDAEDGSIYIDVKGEIEADEYEVVLDVPEGWDGFISYPFTSNVTIGDAAIAPRKIAATDHDWTPVANFEEEGYVKGNKFTFTVNGEWAFVYAYLYKGDQVDNNAFISLQTLVTKAGGGEIEAPQFPKSLEYTLNGEKELEGISVTQQFDDTYHLINITGECDSETLSVTFATPEGWDGLMIADFFGFADISTITRGEAELTPVADVLGMGFKEGNTVTVVADGEANPGYIALVKGDMVCTTFIDYDITVSKVGGGDEPIGDDPTFPETIGITSYAEGLNIEQTAEEGLISININGEIEEEEFDVILDVPEGWDGFISLSYDDVEIGESVIAPRQTRAEDSLWVPVEDLVEDDFVVGNKFTFKANGEEQYVSVYLYKGDVADMAYTISITNEGVTQTGTAIGDLAEENQKAYEEVVSKIEDLTSEYQTALSELKEKYPEYDFSEWEEIIGGTLEQVLAGAKQALDAANEDGEQFTYAFDGEEIEAMIAEMKKAPNMELEAANEAAYAEVIAQIDAVQAKYEAAIVEITEKNPDFNFEEWSEIGTMIEQYRGWAAQALEAANEDGESFFFPFDGEELEAYIQMMLMAAESAEYPESYDVTLSNNEGVEVSQGVEQDVYTISVTGKSKETELTLTLEVPEGWDGFIGMNDIDGGAEIEPLSTRGAEDAYWLSVEEAMAYGFKEGNTMTFPVDGQYHSGQFYLCKDGMADMGNPIMIEFEVEYDDPSGVAGVNAAENASYYDLQGNKINNPKAGMYVKVVDVMASKVVVK